MYMYRCVHNIHIHTYTHTGMALSRGGAIALVNDYTWLPANFVKESLSFFQRHPASLLAYPYDAYAPCTHMNIRMYVYTMDAYGYAHV